MLGPLLASTGAGGLAFARFHSGHPWLFMGGSALLLALAYWLSVVRGGSRAARWTFFVSSLLVAALSLWPQPSAPGRILAGLSLLGAGLAVPSSCAIQGMRMRIHGMT